MNLSGSKTQLALLCQFFTRDDVTWPDDPPSAAAQIGLWYHAVCAWFLAKVFLGDPSGKPKEPACMGDACELTPMEDARALMVEVLGYDPTKEMPEREITKFLPEAAYVYGYTPRGVIVRYLGCDIGREYGELASDELPCSLDVVILQDRRAIIVDWKTGDPSNVEPAKTNAQLALGAVCVAQHHGCTEVEVQLRYPDGFVDRRTYDAFDLLDAEEQINDVVAKCNSDPQPQPGLRCTSKWCPIRATCPATQATLAALPENHAVDLVKAAGGAIMGPGHAGTLYHRAQAARALLDRVDAAIKTYVDEHGPIPLGDGKEYALASHTEEPISAPSTDALYEAIKGHIGPEEYAALIRVSVPKGALETAIKAAVTDTKRGAKTKAWNAAWSAIQAAGMTKPTTIQRHKVRNTKS
jgi:hypothetical protein